MKSVDFRNQLKRQLNFLKNSCRLYDDDDLEEAIRIATCLRVLFHTTSSSTSLLKHLNADSCTLLSTIMDIRGQREVFALIEMRGRVKLSGGSFQAYPKLDLAKHRRLITYNEWWNEEPIISAGGLEGGCATRRKLVLWAANKDGGAHVDDEIPDSYLSTMEGLGMAFVITGEDDVKYSMDQQIKMPLENLHLASLRQIAYEVLASPDLLQLSIASENMKTESKEDEK